MAETQTYYGKSLFASKTFWFNVITGLLALLQAQDVLAVLPASLLKYSAMFIAVGNTILRLYTVRPAVLSVPGSDAQPVTVAKLAIVLAFLPFALTMPACASAPVNPNRGTAGQIAEKGLIVADVIGQIQQAAVALQKTAPERFTAPIAIAFQEHVKESSDVGRKLAAALRIVDAARTSGDPSKAASSVSEARDLISKLTSIIIAATSLLGDSAGSSQIVALIRTLLETTNAILFELGKGPVS